MIIDFHVHSKYSFDCFLEPAKIIALARRHGIDGLAITDHDTMRGVAEFRAQADGLYIIAGQEISTPQGDILGLFLQKEIGSCRDAVEVVRRIRGQGGLAVLAHPFKWPHLARRRAFLELFDAVEVFNARNNIPFPRLENALAAAAVRRLGLRPIAGSDAHEGMELGMAKTIFEFSGREADDEKVKEAILRKRLRVEGREVALGREIASHFSRLLKGFLR